MERHLSAVERAGSGGGGVAVPCAADDGRAGDGAVCAAVEAVTTVVAEKDVFIGAELPFQVAIAPCPTGCGGDVGLRDGLAIDNEGAVGKGDGFVGEAANAFDGDFTRLWFVECDDIAAFGVAVVGESACGEDEIALEQEGLHAVAGDVESAGTEEVKEASGV